MSDTPDIIFARKAGPDSEWDILAWEKNFHGADRYYHDCIVQELFKCLQEAFAYVPDHHGPINHRITAILHKTEGLT